MSSDQQPATTSTMTDVITLLREHLPAGGEVTGQFHRMDDGRWMLDLHEITSGDVGYDELPEEVLGQDTYERLSNLLHDMLDAGTLPYYSEGDKFYEFSF